MSTHNKLFLEQREIEQLKDRLTNYELSQLKIHGNVLRETGPDEEDSEDRRPTSEENYIYSLENELPC